MDVLILTAISTALLYAVAANSYRMGAKHEGKIRYAEGFLEGHKHAMESEWVSEARPMLKKIESHGNAQPN